MGLEKIEKIRRLLSVAILECDTPSLAEAKKSMMKAVSEISNAERLLAKKKKKLGSSQENPKVKVVDPLRAILKIDRMVDEENQKISGIEEIFSE